MFMAGSVVVGVRAAACPRGMNLRQSLPVFADREFMATAMQTLAVDIGPRPVASSAMAAARDAICAMLNIQGPLDITVEALDVMAWEPGTAVLSLPPAFAPRDTVLHCVHTAAGQASGRLLDLRAQASAGDAGAAAPAGAVILMEMGKMPDGTALAPFEQLRAVEQWDPAAVIMQTPADIDCPAIAKGGVFEPLRMPAIAVSRHDGEAIGRLAAQSDAPVTIEASGRGYPARCANLVIDIPPNISGDAEAMVLLSAHLDSFHVGAGAFDNLSGVICAMDIVRALLVSGAPRRCRLRLTLFTGEECGFLGSRAYVAAHADELADIRLVYNLDGLFPPTAAGLAVMGSPQWEACFRRLAAALGLSLDVRGMFCSTSDYLPFVLAGLPAVRPADWSGAFPDWYHTCMDAAGRYPLEWIMLNAAAHGRLIAGLLAEGHTCPRVRNSPASVAAMVASAGAGPKLSVYGFDRQVTSC